MPAVPSKVASRIAAGLKRFQPILAAARARDINESDTVVIVTDMLADIFGYDKFTDVTSEHAIRGTFCDLAIKLDGELVILVEVKAIGLDLKDGFVKQAVDYAANQGVDWVVLTNGIRWRVYRVSFTKPIDHEIVVEFDFLELNHKDEAHVDLLWLLTKESWQKEALKDHHTQKQALSRFTLGAILLSETVVDVLRRELRRVTPGIRIEAEEIRSVLLLEVLKRDVVEGDKADAARRTVAKAMTKALKAKAAGTIADGIAEPNAPVSESAAALPPDTPTPPADQSPLPPQS